jgi:hypothetical protein
VKVLVACEFSGVVRRAFRERGHIAYSCDILPAEDGSPFHVQRDALAVLRLPIAWDLMIAHPPCTYLSRAGARWWKDPERQVKADEAEAFAAALRDAAIPRIAIENPHGQLSTRWRKPDQVVQPFEYGHPYSKATCLWLKNLPLLQPTDVVVDAIEPWIRSSKRDGKNARGKDRSRTFTGIAAAMAEQWGSL